MFKKAEKIIPAIINLIIRQFSDNVRLGFKPAKQLRQSLGQDGESIAATYLKRRYYHILHRNWRVPSGEIDLVAREGRTLVFVEVKSRDFRGDQSFSPLAAVDLQKQRKLQDLAERYLLENRVKIKRQRIINYRFDTIGVIRYRSGGWGLNFYRVEHYPASFSFNV